MAVQLPTPEQVRAAASEAGLSLTDEDVQSYIGLMKASVEAYNLVDAMPDCLPAVKYPRTPGRFPSAEENKHNAWYVKTTIAGADAGPLKGKKIAIKDNTMVAGVPMMNGNSILEGYVPEIDATVVTRLLDAGAEIIGKTHCESYCLSGGSHTGAKGSGSTIRTRWAIRRADRHRGQEWWWRLAKRTWRWAETRADPFAYRRAGAEFMG